MTNEEAINWLKLDISMMKFDPDTGEEAYLTDDARNVMHAEEMAIEALKSKWIPVSDQVPEDDRLVIVCTEWDMSTQTIILKTIPSFGNWHT